MPAGAMKRNTVFHSRDPVAGRDDLKLNESPTGPFAFLNPTHAKYGFIENISQPVNFRWRSRDNRKGRHALQVPSEGGANLPPRTNTTTAVLKGITRMFYRFPVWDISWLVAFIFTLGSVVWVINGCFSWFPLVAPSTEFPNEVYYGAGLTAFIGAIIFFETGSILLLFEAINENNTACFGWAVEQLNGEARVDALKHHCRHHHQNKGNLVGKGALLSSAKEEQENGHSQGRAWQWWPSSESLRTHYLHQIGFLAGLFQFIGATIFGIAGFTILPGIYNHIEDRQGLLDGVFWVPQVVGGFGFIISSTLYMLETQAKWWKPELSVLGWHIGFWNFIGAMGFTLCGALGLDPSASAQYAASLASFIGSWAFLIGSLIQLYESLEKYPVETI